jgi:hypothetical protein
VYCRIRFQLSTSERDFVDENGGIHGFIRLRREVASFRELRMKRFFLRSQSARALSLSCAFPARDFLLSGFFSASECCKPWSGADSCCFLIRSCIRKKVSNILWCRKFFCCCTIRIYKRLMASECCKPRSRSLLLLLSDQEL